MAAKPGLSQDERSLRCASQTCMIDPIRRNLVRRGYAPAAAVTTSGWCARTQRSAGGS